MINARVKDLWVLYSVWFEFSNNPDNSFETVIPQHDDLVFK